MSLLTLLDIDPVQLTGFAREAVAADPHRLEAVLPTQNVGDLDFEMARGGIRRGNVAKFRAYNGVAAIGKRQTLKSVRGSLPPISEQIDLGEEEILRIQRVIETGRPDPALVRAIYDDGRTRALAVADRMELARGEALNTGEITITENGLDGLTLDFGRNASLDVTAGTLWSNHSGSTPITNLLAWEAVYKGINGFTPGAWLAGDAVKQHLLLNTQVSSLLVNLQGVNPSLLTPGQMDTVLQAHGIAPFVFNDDLFYVDDVATRVIPANRIVAVPPAGQPLGRSFWTITAEALALAGSGKIRIEEAPGITVTVRETEEPVSIWTKASGIGIPFLANPDLTMGATVA